MRRLVMFVVLAAFAASLLVFARRSPVQYKVWIMDSRAPEDYREGAALGLFADSIRAKLGGDVARRPAPAGGSAPQKR